MNTLNWIENDYFSNLIHGDKRSNEALEMLVEDLHSDKDSTINTFLAHSGCEDFLWGLVKLLGSDNARVAGNSAYIIGTLAETDLGCVRVIALTGAAKPSSSCFNNGGGGGGGSARNAISAAQCSKSGQGMLADLTRMLEYDDTESMMNAAGTIGTLAETTEGRQWILQEHCLPKMISNITHLLSSSNLWTSSNAALVFARLSISEDGCNVLLNHSCSDDIITMLIHALGTDEAGRGMNAAFAIGRLCDLETGRERLLSLPDSEKMIIQMAVMLSSCDGGVSKNACFALSCLAASTLGHRRLLTTSKCDTILKSLAMLVGEIDDESSWFAAMTLRTLASLPQGCVKLRNNQFVIPALKKTEENINCETHEDLLLEITQTLEILKRLSKPEMPAVEVIDAHSINVTWSAVVTKCNFPIDYMLSTDDNSRLTQVYKGPDCEYLVGDLCAFTRYSFRLRVITDGDESPYSSSISCVTSESAPEEPSDLQVLGVTGSLLKIGWSPPVKKNGNIRGYVVFNGGKIIENNYNENSLVISGLASNSEYTIEVCAITSKGRGKLATLLAKTTELGAHAPTKPEVSVIGRKELNISWKPPEVPLGRISRYDLCMDNQVIYSGTELHFVARRLKPGTEYTFMVSAITNEGRCDSKITKKKTSKDEYDVERTRNQQSLRKDSLDGSANDKFSANKQQRQPSLTAKPTPAFNPKRLSSANKANISKSGNNIGVWRSSTKLSSKPNSRRSSIRRDSYEKVKKTQENEKSSESNILSHSLSEVSIEDSVRRLSRPRPRATSEPLTSEPMHSEPNDSADINNGEKPLEKPVFSIVGNQSRELAPLRINSGEKIMPASSENMQAMYTKRARAFTAYHRPSLKMPATPLTAADCCLYDAGSLLASHPTPSASSTSTVGKFVPMQLRTQPANYPRSASSHGRHSRHNMVDIKLGEISKPLRGMLDEVNLPRSRTSLLPRLSCE